MNGSVLRLAFGIIFAPLCCTWAGAAPVTNVLCQSTTNFLTTNPPTQSFENFAGIPVSCDTNAADLAIARASSTPGVLGAFAETAGDGNCINCPGGTLLNDAQAQAFFSDDFKIVGAPAGLGMIPVLAVFSLHGTQIGSSDLPLNNPFADTDFVGGVITGLVGVFQDCTIHQTRSGTVALACLATAPIDAVAGAAFTIQASLALHAGAGLPALADFSSTARLQEIDFLDSQGQPIAGITVTSASGATYQVGPVPAGVPEPSTLILAIAGMLGFGTRAAASLRRHRIESFRTRIGSRIKV